MHALVAHNTHDKQRWCEAVQRAQHGKENLHYQGGGEERRGGGTFVKRAFSRAERFFVSTVQKFGN